MDMARARAVPTIQVAVIFTVGLAAVGCASNTAPVAGNAPTVWTELHRLCGQAFEGRVAEGTEPSDAAMRSQRLVMHVQSCSDTAVRVPFHVGDDRSRTWVITRTSSGLRLKHDHRHEDGTPDATTEYGGDSRGPDGVTVEFPADEFTAKLLPAAATNVWTLSLEPSGTFTYALRRENSPRRFRAEFDLTKPVAPPPPPW
jgi:hypothetical protein